MEIIAGIERRRQWRVEDKLRIVAEAERPGACFVEVARRHEVSRSVLWAWRRQVRQGNLAPGPAAMFVPLRVSPDGPAVPPGAAAVPTVHRPRRTRSPQARSRSPCPVAR
ncbi:IS66-like element accessory protein TnpA [Roseomonas sp. 18066]|uniref:IS66-like element accessory protein TnpA n=1 Tax=Roseomonas sp. 18066 TaxID=2681412 RepID=UPI0013569B46|nr:transposase [Roseomonas sp. 18066]